MMIYFYCKYFNDSVSNSLRNREIGIGLDDPEIAFDAIWVTDAYLDMTFLEKSGIGINFFTFKKKASH